MGAFEDRQKTGMVFNIQKYSVHDGPGIRTIAFLKGCPLSCRWCSNPESQRMQPDLAYNAGRCLKLDKCHRCLDACPRGALRPQDDGTLQLARELCQDCAMPCAEACPAQGLLVYGKRQSVQEVLTVVEQDAAFYSRSGGGMTLSGGEPLMQGEFATALLREARRRRIKTAVETCGMVPWPTLEEAAGSLHSVLFDVKHADPAAHEAQTGLPNTLALENLRKLAEGFPDLPILARTPVIPGFNDTEEAIAAIAGILAPYPHVQYEMLPYHRLGTQKYVFLGRTSEMGDVTLPTSVLKRLQRAALDILGERVHIPA